MNDLTEKKAAEKKVNTKPKKTTVKNIDVVDEINSENNSEPQTEKKQELRDIYMVEYYVKDLSIDKIIETNIEAKKSQSYAVVYYNGLKPILGASKSIFPKVEAELKTMKVNDERTLKLDAKDSYGIRSKDLLRVVPFNVFKQNNLRPVVGLTIDIGGTYGTIRSVSGGRVMIDFNSPYADHDIEVYVKLKDKPEGKSKIDAALKGLMPSLQTKELSYDETKKELTIKLDKAKYNEQQIKGLEQILLATIKSYVALDKVNVVLE